MMSIWRSGERHRNTGTRRDDSRPQCDAGRGSEKTCCERVSAEVSELTFHLARS